MYLVAGGKKWPDHLSSTEILTEGFSRWKEVGPLPYGLQGLRGVSVNNRIFMTGNTKTIYNFLDAIASREPGM